MVASITAAFAHEIGTTRVVASFAPDDSYTIEVTTDADALLARLEIARKQPRSSLSTTTDMQRGFDALCDDIPRQVTVSFDGVASSPQASCLVEQFASGTDLGLNVPGVTVTLRGSVPSGAKTFVWRYGWTFASYALTVKSSHASQQAGHTIWLEGGQQSQAIVLAKVEPPPSRADVARTYFTLGFTHILPGGPDHILFVLGIFLLSRRLRPMVWQVSAFTIAHSVTLGLTIYGVISLPSSIVEPLIALSIVYVAVENLVTSDLKAWRVALVFLFGLLHGMGFAGVLSELALPRSEYLTGLVAFNLASRRDSWQSSSAHSSSWAAGHAIGPATAGSSRCRGRLRSRSSGFSGRCSV
jgi:hydrogenase/urease accessory protein HupE